MISARVRGSRKYSRSASSRPGGGSKTMAMPSLAGDLRGVRFQPTTVWPARASRRSGVSKYCACSEIGKHLGLPTQAYIALSDAKQLDAQAGLEAAMGAHKDDAVVGMVYDPALNRAESLE